MNEEPMGLVRSLKDDLDIVTAERDRLRAAVADVRRRWRDYVADPENEAALDEWMRGWDQFQLLDVGGAKGDDTPRGDRRGDT